MKFEITSRWEGKILFSIETETIRLAVEAAVKSRANLYGADLSRANLSRANLYGADLSRANLYGANLSRADLSRANLYGANLYGADLSRANLSRANLYGADLSRANLSRANLYGADLSRANLYGANLSGANLYGANLYGANLSGADLSRANLSGANLSGANLYGAKNFNKYLTTPLLMMLDQPGKVRAYKLVNENFEGPFNGGLKYVHGKTLTVENADCNEQEQCAAGINLATLDWCMKNWKEGFHILIAEFEASDIAAIPTATDGKFRVKSCIIVGEKDLTEIGLTKT